MDKRDKITQNILSKSNKNIEIDGIQNSNWIMRKLKLQEARVVLKKLPPLPDQINLSYYKLKQYLDFNSDYISKLRKRPSTCGSSKTIKNFNSNTSLPKSDLNSGVNNCGSENNKTGSIVHCVSKFSSVIINSNENSIEQMPEKSEGKILRSNKVCSPNINYKNAVTKETDITNSSRVPSSKKGKNFLENSLISPQKVKSSLSFNNKQDLPSCSGSNYNEITLNSKGAKKRARPQEINLANISRPKRGRKSILEHPFTSDINENIDRKSEDLKEEENIDKSFVETLNLESRVLRHRKNTVIKCNNEQEHIVSISVKYDEKHLTNGRSSSDQSDKCSASNLLKHKDFQVLTESKNNSEDNIVISSDENNTKEVLLSENIRVSTKIDVKNGISMTNALKSTVSSSSNIKEMTKQEISSPNGKKFVSSQKNIKSRIELPMVNAEASSDQNNKQEGNQIKGYLYNNNNESQVPIDPASQNKINSDITRDKECPSAGSQKFRKRSTISTDETLIDCNSEKPKSYLVKDDVTHSGTNGVRLSSVDDMPNLEMEKLKRDNTLSPSRICTNEIKTSLRDSNTINNVELNNSPKIVSSENSVLSNNSIEVESLHNSEKDNYRRKSFERKGKKKYERKQEINSSITKEYNSDSVFNDQSENEGISATIEKRSSSKEKFASRNNVDDIVETSKTDNTSDPNESENKAKKYERNLNSTSAENKSDRTAISDEIDNKEESTCLVQTSRKEVLANKNDQALTCGNVKTNNINNPKESEKKAKKEYERKLDILSSTSGENKSDSVVEENIEASTSNQANIKETSREDSGLQESNKDNVVINLKTDNAVINLKTDNVNNPKELGSRARRKYELEYESDGIVVSGQIENKKVSTSVVQTSSEEELGSKNDEVSTAGSLKTNNIDPKESGKKAMKYERIQDILISTSAENNSDSAMKENIEASAIANSKEVSKEDSDTKESNKDSNVINFKTDNVNGPIESERKGKYNRKQEILGSKSVANNLDNKAKSSRTENKETSASVEKASSSKEVFSSKNDISLNADNNDQKLGKKAKRKYEGKQEILSSKCAINNIDDAVVIGQIENEEVPATVKCLNNKEVFSIKKFVSPQKSDYVLNLKTDNMSKPKESGSKINRKQKGLSSVNYSASVVTEKVEGTSIELQKSIQVFISKKETILKKNNVNETKIKIDSAAQSVKDSSQSEENKIDNNINNSLTDKNSLNNIPDFSKKIITQQSKQIVRPKVSLQSNTTPKKPNKNCNIDSKSCTVPPKDPKHHRSTSVSGASHSNVKLFPDRSSTSHITQEPNKLILLQKNNPKKSLSTNTQPVKENIEKIKAMKLQASKMTTKKFNVVTSILNALKIEKVTMSENKKRMACYLLSHLKDKLNVSNKRKRSLSVDDFSLIRSKNKGNVLTRSKSNPYLFPNVRIKVNDSKMLNNKSTFPFENNEHNVFKIPTKTAPKAKKHYISNSNTFIKPKSNEYKLEMQRLHYNDKVREKYNKLLTQGYCQNRIPPKYVILKGHGNCMKKEENNVLKQTIFPNSLGKLENIPDINPSLSQQNQLTKYANIDNSASCSSKDTRNNGILLSNNTNPNDLIQQNRIITNPVRKGNITLNHTQDNGINKQFEHNMPLNGSRTHSVPVAHNSKQNLPDKQNLYDRMLNIDQIANTSYLLPNRPLCKPSYIDKHISNSTVKNQQNNKNISKTIIKDDFSDHNYHAKKCNRIMAKPIQNNNVIIQSSEIAESSKKVISLEKPEIKALSSNSTTVKEEIISHKKRNHDVCENEEIVERKKIKKSLFSYEDTIQTTSNIKNEQTYTSKLRSATTSKNNSSPLSSPTKIKSPKKIDSLKKHIDNFQSIINNETTSSSEEIDKNNTAINISDQNEDLSKILEENSDSTNLATQVCEFVAELRRLDETALTALSNYKKSIGNGEGYRELKALIPKDGLKRMKDGERPPDWFIKFIPGFRKEELWRLHQMFKVHDHLMRIESAKLTVLEKIYEELKGNENSGDDKS